MSAFMVRASFQALPGPRSELRVSLWPAADFEYFCDDGVDNDEDCLVDDEDPDCR